MSCTEPEKASLTQPFGRNFDPQYLETWIEREPNSNLEDGEGYLLNNFFFAAANSLSLSSLT
jgi:hypothetical protein